MTPEPAQKMPTSSAQNSEIALLWRRYLACRDERSHDQLLRAVDRLIRHEAQRMLASHAYLAEEAAQETLLGIERKIASLDVPEYPAAFIRKVLSNKISTILQRESRRRAREERNWTPEVPDENISTGTEWHEFLGTLRTAVNDDEFWTLVLHYHFDFSYDEIGELLEKEVGTIRQIALRGRRKCRQRLSQLEGRVPAWFGVPIEVDEQWRLKEPNETTTQPGLPDPPPEITARKAGEWGQDISGSADGLRRASIGSDSSAPREPKTTLRRFGQLTVHVGTATSRLGGVGRRWLYTAPSSVLPLVVLVAVPALAFFPDANASAVLLPATSSEPTGPTATVLHNSGAVTAGGGSAGADRAGRQDVVERPIDQSPTGPAQFPTETTQTDQVGEPTASTAARLTATDAPTTFSTSATAAPAAAETTTTEPELFFDQAIPPSGTALPVPTEPADTDPEQSTTAPTAEVAETTEPADTVPAAPVPTNGTDLPTTAAPTTAATTVTVAPTAPPTTARTTTTTAQATTATRQRTTTTAATTTTTTSAPTTTTIAPTTTTTTTEAQTTTTAAPTTTAPTTTTTLATTTTTEPTTTTTAATTTSTEPTTTTTDATTTAPTTLPPPPPVGPTSPAF